MYEGVKVTVQFYKVVRGIGDELRLIAEAEMAGMLGSAGSTANVRRQPVTVITGFRGDARDPEPSILDRFFGPTRNVRVMR